MSHKAMAASVSSKGHTHPLAAWVTQQEECINPCNMMAEYAKHTSYAALMYCCRMRLRGGLLNF
jgi:hypothetical protein